MSSHIAGGRRKAGFAVFEVFAVIEVRGASNEKAKRELAWQPHHPSWRQGIAEASSPVAI